MKFPDRTGVRYRSLLALAKCCTWLVLAQVPVGQACPVDNRQMEIAVAGHSLTAEVAANLASHMCGLAFRHELAPDQGMLFAYAQDRIVGFWMMNTHIALSIAFLNAEGRIMEIHDMDPREPARHHISTAPARYALEVNQGWFRDNGIEVGDRAEFDLRSGPEVFRYRADH